MDSSVKSEPVERVVVTVYFDHGNAPVSWSTYTTLSEAIKEAETYKGIEWEVGHDHNRSQVEAF